MTSCKRSLVLHVTLINVSTRVSNWVVPVFIIDPKYIFLVLLSVLISLPYLLSVHFGDSDVLKLLVTVICRRRLVYCVSLCVVCG
jgi:hypothetical protein